MGTRNGFGTLEVASRKNSKYTGGWKEDKRNGYGVYNDKMRFVIIIIDYYYNRLYCCYYCCYNVLLLLLLLLLLL